MKWYQMLTFFGIVFTLYGLINYYIIRRALAIVSPQHKTFFLAVSVFLVLSYIAGRFLERAFPSIITTTLIWIGSFWIAFMFYFFFSLVAIDLLRLINHYVPFFPEIFSKNPEKAKRFTALAILLFVFVTVAGGYINTKMIVVQNYKIQIKKNAGNLKSLNIAMASDIHLGTILDSAFLEKVVKKINALNPDIVLLPGDIIDEDIGPVLRDNMGHLLESIKSKYGVYAVTGNHEYIGGVDAACNYLSSHGIKMLRDSVVKIDNNFYLIGREDIAIRQFAHKQRKDLKELLTGVDTSLPLILMDHEPFRLNEAFENGIDLQLSGHTHNGQLWPMNFLISKIYELGWGYMIKGNTHYYVSCGVGGWGPPIRTGSRPEIVNLKIAFVNRKKMP